MSAPYGSTVQVLDGSVGEATYSDDTRTWPVKATLNNVVVAPAGTNELVDGRETVTWDLDLYPPPGTDIAPIDRVVIDGIDYEVFGNKQEWVSPFDGWAPGGFVRLQRVTG